MQWHAFIKTACVAFILGEQSERVPLGAWMDMFVGQFTYDLAELVSIGGGGGLCANHVSLTFGSKGVDFVINVGCLLSLLV